MLKGLLFFFLSGMLAGCSWHATGWHWEHAVKSDPAQLYRAKDECRMYLDSTRSSDRFGIIQTPHITNEWDEDFKACMAEHGWTYVEEP